MNLLEWSGKLVEQIIKSIENTGRVGVQSLHTKADSIKQEILEKVFSVKVVNQVSKVDVKGTVIVGNQVKLEKRIEDLYKPLKDLLTAVSGNKSVEIANFPKQPEFPKQIEVSNLSNKTELVNVGLITDALGRVQKSVDKLKLDPTIKVEAPKIPAPIVTIPAQPAPIVNVKEREIDLSALDALLDFWKSLSGGAKKSLSVRLTDGKEFYKAMEKMGDIFTANNSSHFQYYSGGEARPVVNKNNELKVTSSETWDINHSDKVSTALEYIGEESVDAVWRIRKMVKSGTVTTVTYATVKNNSTVSGYDEAWTGRTELIYSKVSEAF